MAEPTEEEEELAKHMAEQALRDAIMGETEEVRRNAMYMIKAAEAHRCPIWRVIGALNEVIPKYGEKVPVAEMDKAFAKWSCELVVDEELRWLREEKEKRGK